MWLYWLCIWYIQQNGPSQSCLMEHHNCWIWKSWAWGESCRTFWIDECNWDKARFGYIYWTSNSLQSCHSQAQANTKPQSCKKLNLAEPSSSKSYPLQPSSNETQSSHSQTGATTNSLRDTLNLSPRNKASKAVLECRRWRNASTLTTSCPQLSTLIAVSPVDACRRKTWR